MRRTVAWVALLIGVGVAHGQVAVTPPASPAQNGGASASPAVLAQLQAIHNNAKTVLPEPGKLPPTIVQSEVQAAETPDGHNLTTFDHRFAELRWQSDHWQLVSGRQLIKDFDNRQLEAEEAVRIIRELRLNQRGTIGVPRPVMEYWLSDGHAPSPFVRGGQEDFSPLRRGGGGGAPMRTVAGLRLLPFDPASLALESLGGKWCIKDQRRIYFNFGSQADDAKRALQIIQQNGFDRVGYVGQPVPIMLYFVTTQTKTDAAPAPLPQVPAMHMPTSAGNLSAGARLGVSGLTPNAAPPWLPPSPSPLPGALVPQPATSHLRLPDQAILGERIPFDWRQARARKESNEWRLVSGGHALARFGDRERDAQQALAALRHYRFSEQGLIGKGGSSFSYYLVNGQAPRGLMLGIENIAFHPDRLIVQQIGKNYVVSDDSRVLLRFGEKGDDARQALNVLRQLECDHLCRIGVSENGGMVFPVRVH